MIFFIILGTAFWVATILAAAHWYPGRPIALLVALVCLAVLILDGDPLGIAIWTINAGVMAWWTATDLPREPS